MKKYIIILLAIFFSVSSSYAATIYVDGTCADCSGNYSIANQACDGSDGDSYDTVQEAITNMSVGDHIYLRGGTYSLGGNGSGDECVDIPTSKNGTAWTGGNYNKLSSYPGEWAILDGQNNCGSVDSAGVVIGHYSPDHDAAADIKYWLFERLEIKNGSKTSRTMAAGFCGNGGPFKFRYCYIHDNAATYAGNNPGGLKGWHWQDSTVEFCYIADNGIVTQSGDDNPSNIMIYSDYDHDDTAEYGFDNENSNRPVARNIIRYNYITGSNVGIKYKSGQLFTGRNPAGGHGWSDTYNTYGDKVHHNIVKDARAFGIAMQQDFGQVYNNILDDCNSGIAVRYQPDSQLYKVVTYNNTIVSSPSIPFVRYGLNIYAFEPYDHYGWDYNNLFDDCGDASAWCTTEAMSVIPYGSSCSGNTLFDLSNYYNTDNYFYRPQETDLFRLRDTSYTQTEFESQSLTHTPRVAYENAYDAGNLLYEGTTGADKYRTKGTHQIEGGVTVADGGVGGNHPYLAGVTIPSYVGATNPDDNDWVAGVLGLTVNYFTSQTSGSDPSWIEGSSGASLTGTLLDGATEAQIVTGGETLILTLTTDTWHDDIGTDCTQTDDLIAGITSGGTETYGWNNVVKANLVFGDITRTSDIVVTILLGAEATFAIIGNETVTVTIPASILVTSDDPVIATPTLEITAANTVITLTGTLSDNATEAQIVAGGETIIGTVSGDTLVATFGDENGITTDFIAGLDGDGTEWDAVVKAGLTYANVTRDSDTQFTVLLPAFAAFDISANEGVTVTVPASSLTVSENPVVGSPEFNIIFFETSTEKITGMTLQ